MRTPSAPLALAALLAAAVPPAGPAAAFTAAEARTPMTVTLVRDDAPTCGADCPEWLALTGKIGFETPARFNAALARLRGRRVPVVLDSPGGETTAGLAMGRAIRAHGLNTVVASTALTPCAPADRACAARLAAGEHPGHLVTAGTVPACASACVLALAGGVHRAVGPGAAVGVHQARQVKTFHPVINTFRILRRIVNGRAVEISRTLVSRRALPVRVVSGAAPESLYSAFDRHLLSMGVDESIMPLMRAVPPSGVHWLTRAELGSTRIADDGAEPKTVLARAAIPPEPPRGAMALAAVTGADGRRAFGIVDWHIDRSGAEPALVGAADVPGRALRATVTLRRAAQPGTADAVLAAVELAPGAPAAAPEAPQVCDGAVCSHPALPAGAAGRFAVPMAWRDDALLVLRERPWLKVDLASADGARAALDLSLTDDAHALVERWERLCWGPEPDAPPAPHVPAPLPDPTPAN